MSKVEVAGHSPKSTFNYNTFFLLGGKCRKNVSYVAPQVEEQHSFDTVRRLVGLPTTGRDFQWLKRGM
jgi:hypothetical protein